MQVNVYVVSILFSTQVIYGMLEHFAWLHLLASLALLLVCFCCCNCRGAGAGRKCRVSGPAMDGRGDAGSMVASTGAVRVVGATRVPRTLFQVVLLYVNRQS